MCKLITISKKSNQNDNIIKKILLSQIDVIFLERDGIGALTIDQNSKEIVVDRSLTDYKGVMSRFINNIPKSCFMSLHSRTCTAGDKSLANVHFFNKKNLYLAHNGMVSDYSQQDNYHFGFENDDYHAYPPQYSDMTYQQKLINTYSKELNDKTLQAEAVKNKTKPEPKEVKSDTLKFLNSLPLKINEKKLADKMLNGFYGVATLVDAKKRKVYQFSTKDYDAYTDLHDFIITFSYKPDIETKTILFGYSLPVENASDSCKLITITQNIVSFNY
jgi:predicted glutamine amidotransferase